MTTIPDDMVERVARALREADIIWGARRYPEKSVKEIRDLVEDASDDLGYEGLARAAIEAMQPAILAAEKRGEERERERTDKALREYRARLNDIPLGHENAQRGASTYNWKVTVYEEIAAAIRKGSD